MVFSSTKLPRHDYLRRGASRIASGASGRPRSRSRGREELRAEGRRDERRLGTTGVRSGFLWIPLIRSSHFIHRSGFFPQPLIFNGPNEDHEGNILGGKD